MPFQPGDLLANKYSIQAEIGHGAFGRVYRARDEKLDRLVAIKELNKGDDGLESVAFNEFARRFEREARVQARFNHPNIVHVYELIRLDAGQLCLVMEYVDGESLAERLKRGPLAPAEATRIMRDALAGLAVVHDDKTDIVHRDLKPSNILLTRSGQAKLADFGLAQNNDDESLWSSEGKPQSGTPLYMSPEQETNSAYLYPSSDVFSAACVLFEMVAGIPYKQARRRNQGLRDLRPDAPAWLEQLLAAALAPRAEDRPPNGAEFLRQLEVAVKSAEAHPAAPNAVAAPVALAPARLVPPVLTEAEVVSPENVSRLSLAYQLGEPKIASRQQGRLHELTMSPDGSIVFAWERGGPTQSWNLESGAPVSLDNGPDRVDNIRFAPTGRTLVTRETHPDRPVICKIWRLEDRFWDPALTVVYKWSHRRRHQPGQDMVEPSALQIEALRDVALMSNPDRIAALSENRISLWDMKLQRLAALEGIDVGDDDRLVASPDGNTLVTFHSSHDSDCHVWRINPGLFRKNLVRTLKTRIYERRVNFFSEGRFLLESGTTIVSGKRQGTAACWRVADWNHIDAGTTPAISVDASWLAYVRWRDKIELVQLPGLSDAQRLGAPAEVTALALSPDGSVLASGDATGFIRVWATIAGKLRTEVQAHDQATTQLDFALGGRVLVSNAGEGVIKLWKVSPASNSSG